MDLEAEEATHQLVRSRWGSLHKGTEKTDKKPHKHTSMGNGRVRNQMRNQADKESDTVNQHQDGNETFREWS